MPEDSLDLRGLLRALGEWAATTPRGVRSGEGTHGIERIQFHTRPDPRAPEVQLTLRAELVDGHPVIVATQSRPGPGTPRPDRESTLVVGIGPSGDSDDVSRGRDPDATCEGCGTIGTVGRAVRTDADNGVTEQHRFCATCWPEQSARYRARWDEENRRRSDDFLRGREPRVARAGSGTWFQSATWHGTLELVRTIERMMIAPTPPDACTLLTLSAKVTVPRSQSTVICRRSISCRNSASPSPRPPYCCVIRASPCSKVCASSSWVRCLASRW